MDPSLANIDLDSNPYAGTEHDTNKSLRDFALERIMARRENRSQLAQIAWDMRRAVGPDGFHPELRKAVQASSNLMSSLLEAGLRQEPSFRRRGTCSCMRRLPRRSWKPRPRPVTGGTRQPFRQESLTQQESSSTTTERADSGHLSRRSQHPPSRFRRHEVHGRLPNCATSRAIMTPSGSCYRCMSCGSTSGCS
jgi:hypothetical protein